MKKRKGENPVDVQHFELQASVGNFLLLDWMVEVDTQLVDGPVSEWVVAE